MKYVYLLIALLAFSCASKEKRSASMEIPEPAVASSSSSTGASTEPSASAAANAEAAKSSAETAANSPKAVCESLAQAAMKGDWQAIRKNSMGIDMAIAQGQARKKGMGKMDHNYMERLKDLTCTKENIAGDHAVVEAKSEGQERLIPFVKMQDGWKFDERTYHSFYPGPHQSKKTM